MDILRQIGPFTKRATGTRIGLSWLPTLAASVCLCGCILSAAPQRLGLLPAGMSPDSVDFTDAELYVLERGTVSVFSLPAMTLARTFGGSGAGAGKLSPRHTFDQVIRVAGDAVLVEDNNKLIRFSRAGGLVEEKRKPENSVGFVPIGDRYVAKSMVVEGSPPTQFIRAVLYDAGMREVKELYRQPWFQQRQGDGFSTVLLGDLLHFAVTPDRVCVEESPRGFVVECFDSSGNRVQTIDGAQAGVAVTAADRDREMALVRAEKRVALMIEMAGSWEKLRQVWTITFPAVTPPLREIQASAGRLFIRTYVRTDEAVKYLLIDLAGAGRREVWLPLPTDAETEARVSGTAFFKLIGERYYYLRQDARTNRWEVHVTSEPIQSAHLVARARLTMP